MCTLEKRGNVYILTLTGPTEHRVNPALLSSISSALSHIGSQIGSGLGPGSALVTCAEGKFFSNGADLAYLKPSPSDRLSLLSSSFKHVISTLLSLPIPTVAAVTGHAAAAGVGLVLAHDYVIMRSDRGVIYMSEIDLGLTIPPKYFSNLLVEKIGDPRGIRDVVMAGERVSAERGVEMGIVDLAVAGTMETVDAAVALAERLAREKGGFVEMRRAAFPETWKELGLDEEKAVTLDSKL